MENLAPIMPSPGRSLSPCFTGIWEKPSNGTAQSAGGLEKVCGLRQYQRVCETGGGMGFTNKVLNGSGNRLLPKEGATRAQVAQIFYNAYDLLRGQDGEDAEAALEKVEESSRKKA